MIFHAIDNVILLYLRPSFSIIELSSKFHSFKYANQNMQLHDKKDLLRSKQVQISALESKQSNSEI